MEKSWELFLFTSPYVLSVFFLKVVPNPFPFCPALAMSSRLRLQHGWWVVFWTHLTCPPTIICGLRITNNVQRWTNISLGVCFNVKLQWFWQCVLRRCVRFIEDNDKSMVSHEFGDVMFSCHHFISKLFASCSTHVVNQFSYCILSQNVVDLCPLLVTRSCEMWK